MAKVITTELQHSGASGANITLDSSKNVTCENNLTVDGTTTLTGAVTLPNNTVTNAKVADDSITNAKIADDTIVEAKLDISNAPADGKYLQYKDSSDKLTWATPATDLKPWFDAFTDAEQTFSANTHTVMTFGEILDSGGMYDTSNNRFTPTVAGTYYLEAAMVSSGDQRIDAEISIRKNGSKDNNRHSKGNKLNGEDQLPLYTSMIVAANGSSDYFDVYGWYWLHTGSGDKGFSKKHFRGFKIG